MYDRQQKRKKMRPTHYRNGKNTDMIALLVAKSMSLRQRVQKKHESFVNN